MLRPENSTLEAASAVARLAAIADDVVGRRHVVTNFRCPISDAIGQLGDRQLRDLCLRLPCVPTLKDGFPSPEAQLGSVL
jgi:hypothetical protein